MDSIDDTLDTQQLVQIRHELLYGQSDPHPQPQPCEPENSDGGGAELLAAGAKTAGFLEHPVVPKTSPYGSNPRRGTRAHHDDRPSLVISKSSPVHPSLLPERPSGARMNQTFAGFIGDIGDTQPMDSQLVKEYSDLNASKIALNGQTDAYTFATFAQECPRDPADEGVGDVTAAGGPVQVRLALEDTISSIESDMEDEGPRNAIQQEKDSIIFKTPAMAGRKRDYRGEFLSSELATSATKTPGSALAAMFGPRKAAADMSLTQIFQGTQIVSSPTAGAPRSDPIFQRPSPNLRMQDCLVTDVNDQSSPTRLPRSDMLRAISDPLENYTSMKESQERRLQRIHEDHDKRHHLEPEDEFEASFLAGDRSAQLHKARERKMEEGLLQAACLTAPNTRRSVRRKSPAGLLSDWTITPPPANRLLAKSDVVIELSDELNDDESNLLEEECNLPTSAVQVPMTSSRPYHLSQRPQDVQSSPSNHKREHSKTRSIIPGSGSQPHTQNVSRSGAPGATQKIVAIADSQSEPLTPQDSMPRPLVEIPSSVASNPRITQSQPSLSISNRALSGSSIRAVIETSSVLELPPVTSQHNDEAVPSSPPADSMRRWHNVEPRTEHELSDGEIDFVRFGKVMPRSGHEPELNKLSNGSAERQPDEISVDKKDEKGTGSIAIDPQLHVCPVVCHTGVASTAERVNSNSLDMFHSAMSRPLGSASISCPTQLSDAKPRSNSGFKRLTEIAKENTPSGSMESVDIDSIDIITDEDKEHLMVVSGIQPYSLAGSFSGSSPVRPTKRRRTVDPRPLREPARNLNIQEYTEPTSVRSGSDYAYEAHSPKGRMSCISAIAVAETKASPLRPKSDEPRPSRQASRPKRTKKSRKKATGSAQTASSTTRDATAEAKGQVTSLGTALQEPPASAAAEKIDGVLASNQKSSIEAPPAQVAESFRFPHRVLAHFTGSTSGWYPGTCLGTSSADSSKFRVRFDDDTVDTLESHKLARLELRAGDQVKVNIPKMKNKTWVVQGFKDRSEIFPRATTDEDATSTFNYTDVQGHATLQLSTKPTRRSLATTGEFAETVAVSVADIYVTSRMFPNFKDRPYHDPYGEGFIRERYMTPLTAPPASATPTNRRVRQALSVSYGNLSDVSSLALKGAGVFGNMAFAVSIADPEEKKANLSKLLLDHGAHVLESGFDDLFLRTRIGSPPSSKSKGEAKPSTETLHLKDWAKQLGFTALVAEKYCRRVKYMQALALGLPCLHFRWVTDSIAAATPLPFDKYLLPAGESSYLGGAIRSRTLTTYDPLGSSARLADVFNRRDLLFGGRNVLLLSDKRRDEERERTYEFVPLALGAASVARVKSFAEAKAAVQAGAWDFVHVSGNVDAAEEAISAPTGAPKGKKRKKVPKARGQTGSKTGLQLKAPVVVDDEWVIQSLILGALI